MLVKSPLYSSTSLLSSLELATPSVTPLSFVFLFALPFALVCCDACFLPFSLRVSGCASAGASAAVR